MRPIRSVSVLMPTWQGIEFLERVLGALASQGLDVDWDFTAIDSGSTDGTWELLQGAAASFPVPMRLERIHYCFNDVASALRREVWERHPFPRTDFGEDVLLARALLEAGWTVVYDAEATVEHSHDYDARESYDRGRIDGRFNAEWLARVCRPCDAR